MLCIVKKTLEVIKQTGNNAIIQVKSNQPKLFKETEILTEELNLISKYNQPTKTAHGRKESRKVFVYDVPELMMNDLERWQHVNTIVKIIRQRSIFNTKTKTIKPTKEVSYYLSTTRLSAKIFCKLIQDHWRIENVNHYVRDVTLKEDLSRIRKNPGIAARIRSFALNILRLNNVSNIASEMFLNCCNFEKIFNYKELA
jgi:predicted transposase YbfD/YdcC